MKTELEGEKRIRHIYGKLKHYQDDFHDEIPSEIVHGLSLDGDYKCRRAWWQYIINQVEMLKPMGILPEETSKRYHKLIDSYIDKIKQNSLGVSAQDIRSANGLLDEILNVLKSKLGQDF